VDAAEPFGQAGGDRDVGVGEARDVLGREDDARPVIERAGRREPRRGDVADLGARGPERGARARDERRDDRIRTGLWRRARVAPDERGGVVVDACDGGTNVGAAEIETEVERAQTFGSRPATSGAPSAEASVPKTCCCAAR
jgi:hypothetical protein